VRTKTNPRDKAVALTFDIEDYFQVENLRGHFPLETWENVPMRLEKPTMDILDLLDKYGFKGTFFVLGWTALKVPGLVKEIDKRGHEIASHGYSHKLNNNGNLSNEELRKDLSESKEILEQITGKKVYGYRAPSFSVSDDVLGCIQGTGYSYDSSLFPFKGNKKYGSVSGKTICSLETHYSFREFGIPVLDILGLKLPFAGGAYFRLLPLWSIEWATKSSSKDILVFYFHPWEFDPLQPTIKGLSLSKKIRHYWGLGRNLKKLSDFLSFIQSSEMQVAPLKEIGMNFREQEVGNSKERLTVY